MSHSLSVLQASGHLQLREELMSLINFQGAFRRHFILLAKKRRKRVEGISLRSLSQTASYYKRAIHWRQKRLQNLSEAATITLSQDPNQETQKEGLHDSEKYFGDHTKSNDKIDGKQDSIEGNKNSKSTSVKAKSGTQKKSTLPQRKESVPQPAALPMRIRLSNKRSYQSYSKGNTTVSNKTVVDADQNCLPKDTSIISCLTHRFGIDISVGNNRQSVDCQEETVHEVQGAEGFLQLEGEKKHGSWDEADSTSMQDIAKHSDTSTPNRPRRQRHGPSSTCSSATITPKNTSGTTRRSRVPHYPASWLEGLPLPASGNNTTRRKSKKTDTHEAKF
ncbi:uncharacterized protein LOC135099784 [Scylla paramamosain]|uniref:uncharacterized protein LOC135099784 n=1 Tax=Scylla paramamosain TaxID=85552 RepID=UPI0030838C48